MEREGLGPWVYLGERVGPESSRENHHPIAGDRGFESISLQRRVSSEPCCAVDVLLSFLSFLLCRLSVFPASFPVEINALWYNALCLLWFTEAAIATWRAAPRTTRGGQQRYSSLAITTALTLRAVFPPIGSLRPFAS